jgi:phosphate transport system permease protein
VSSATGTLAGLQPRVRTTKAPTSRRPIRPRGFSAADVGLLAVSALSALALSWVVYYQVLPLSGALGFLLFFYVTFLATYWSASAQVADRTIASDRVFSVVMLTGGALAVGLLVFIISWVFVKAIPHVGLSLFSRDTHDFLPADPSSLSKVGVFQAIVGTLEQVAVAAVIGVPMAIGTAVLLNEVGGRFTRTVRTIVTAMSGTPSVVAGVFIYSILIINHVLSFSGFAASLALLVLMIPSVTRTTEEVLRVVSSGLREASWALGAPEWRTVWSVVLPTARSGLVTAVLLGVARAVGETAPLIFTAFGSQVLNTNVFSQPQGALPLVVFQDVRQPQQDFITLAFEAAFVLLVVVLILFVAARLLGRPKRGQRSGFASRIFERGLMPIPMENATEAEEF